MPPVAQVLLVVGGMIAAGLVAAAVLVLVFAVPWQARRRGHGFFPWLVLQTVAVNPIYPLVLVALLPDRAKARLRERFARELDERLRGAGRPVSEPEPAPGAAPDRSLGDLPTAGASVGDLPTTPPERSIGDAETRAGQL